MKTRLILLSLVTLSACGPIETPVPDPLGTHQAQLTAVTGFGSNPGGLNMYKYVPANVPPNAPLVVAMHGCTQTAADYAASGWNAIADQFGFIVLYPEQATANNSLRCFNWAGEYGDATNLQRGQGENESIIEMVKKMQTDHSIDASRIYVTGFSGGGAQTALMLALWPDVFAAGATVAGIPYDCTTTYSEVTTCLKPGKNLSAAEWGNRVRAAMSSYTGTWPKLAIWQGTADSVVAYDNSSELLKQWTNVHGIDQGGDATDTSVPGTTRVQYQDANGVTQVETWAVANMDHGQAVDPSHGDRKSVV